jgi:hypothetical protein
MIVNIIQKKTAINFICKSLKPGFSKIVKTPIPTRANALLNDKENHAAKPPMVPIIGPMLLSMKKKVPPAFGIAVESSAFESIAGIIRILAIAYDKIKAGPALAKPKPGNINNPELIIAPEAIQKISKSPSSLLSPSQSFVLFIYPLIPMFF